MKPIRTVILTLLLMSSAGSFVQAGPADTLISRDRLIQDVRQLVQILETAHPDPYINGGGKIAFHRRIHRIMAGIPAAGLSSSDFEELLSPVFVAIGDGHTRIDRTLTANASNTKLIPIQFRAVENDLYASAVFDEQHRKLLGARLVAVQGVPYAELLKRVYRLQPIENPYRAMAILSRLLRDKRYYDDLLPEWKDKSRISIQLRLPAGEIKDISFPTRDQLVNPIEPPTRVDLPSIEKSSIVYGFLDAEKKSAVLRVAVMDEYREHFEGVVKEIGSLGPVRDAARDAYKRFNGREAPDQDGEIIAGLPSVVELYVRMLEEMKSAGTENLFIDLRSNTGGDDMMSFFLLYLLYGTEGLDRANQATQVVKYSDFYLSFAQGVSLDEINRDRAVPLERNDYDFSGETAGKKTTREDLMSWWAKYPEMVERLRTETHEEAFCPRHVIVLCNERTFSAGYDMMRNLYYNGAAIVGVPSGQAGNSFGNTVPWKLANSAIEGSVSIKCDLSFPNDPERGRVLTPGHALTYAKLVQYGFDPNAAVRYALESFPVSKSARKDRR